MRDDWKRIIELERRQRKNAYEIGSLERTVKAAKEKLKLVDQALPPTIISGGGGGGSNIIRWAKDFCMAVVFDTYPEINPTFSENLTKDTESLEAAIHALETGVFIPPEIYSPGTPGLPEGFYVTGSHSVYYPTASTMWQYMGVAASYSAAQIDEIFSPHLRNIHVRFNCGWFPGESATVETSQYEPDELVDVTGRYVPSVSPARSFGSGSYASVTDIPHWDANFGSIYSPEIAAGFNVYGGYTGDYSASPAFSNQFYVATKHVEFWTYDEDGMKKYLRTLAYHHSPYELTYVGEILEAITLRTPYKHASGPRNGTTGSYLLPAFGSAYGLRVSSGGSGVSNEFFALEPGIGRFGTAELFVSWGSTCEDAVPPITDETPEDWDDFCAAITAASSTFLKIPGLTIKFNGTEIFDDSLGTYSVQPTITFEFAPRLKDYLDANPDVSITYSFDAICGHVPAQAIYDAGEVTDGFSVIFPRNTNCDSRPIETENYLTVKMEASPPRYLFQDECCTPYASHCSVSSLTSNQIVWYLDPP